MTVSPVAAAAARAAVSAAAGLGVDCAEPEVLADGANVIVHLRPSPVVAKVAASTTVVRADSARWLQRELDLAVFLTEAGAPVMAASREVPATAHHADGYVMSFWTYLRPSGTGPADEATIGAMLRDLHGVLRTYPTTLPALPPLGDIPAFLARPQTRLSAADAAALGAAFSRLTEDLASTLAAATSWRPAATGCGTTSRTLAPARSPGIWPRRPPAPGWTAPASSPPTASRSIPRNCVPASSSAGST